MRQGEILAFSPDDVDEERGLVHVVRQLKIVENRPVFALPKGRKTRDVPLSASIADRLREHGRQYPAVEVTLPWESPDGPPTTVRLVLSGKSGVALRRSIYNRDVWWPAAEAADIVRQRQNGMHALRHFYASVLLDAGESIKALAEYLGHADPGFTLRTYTHLMPNSEERTRRAIDQVFGRPDNDRTA
jgi:integrase